MNASSSLRAFLADHAVASIAGAVALATMALVPPDAAYASYFDWRTLSCLLCILGIVAALRRNGFFDTVTRHLLQGFKTTRQIVLMMVAVTGLASMFITNDLALIMMLPLSALLLSSAGHGRLIPLTFILQTLSANLLGMIMPFGNPQNLFLFSFFEIPALQFMATMALPFLASAAGLLGCCLLMVKPQPVQARKRQVGQRGEAKREPMQEKGTAASGAQQAPGTLPEGKMRKKPRLHQEQGPMTDSSRTPSGLQVSKAVRNLLYGCLFLVALAMVFRLMPFPIATAIVVASLLVLDRRALLQVDWGLLLTFLFFFIFSGNLSRVPEVQLAASQLMEANALLVSALLSQVISNVPSTVLLAQFTGNWPALLVGVNVGGAGTVVASLASLITLSQYRAVRAADSSLPSPARYLGLFMLMNSAFLGVLLAVCSAAGIA